MARSVLMWQLLGVNCSSIVPNVLRPTLLRFRRQKWRIIWLGEQIQVALEQILKLNVRNYQVDWTIAKYGPTNPSHTLVVWAGSHLLYLPSQIICNIAHELILPWVQGQLAIEQPLLFPLLGDLHNWTTHYLMMYTPLTLPFIPCPFLLIPQLVFTCAIYPWFANDWSLVLWISGT